MKIDYIRAYSNDGSNPTVALDRVSAPDGKDPGMYGATALNGGPATPSAPVEPVPVSTTPAPTNPVPTTPSSVEPPAQVAPPPVTQPTSDNVVIAGDSTGTPIGTPISSTSAVHPETSGSASAVQPAASSSSSAPATDPTAIADSSAPASGMAHTTPVEPTGSTSPTSVSLSPPIAAAVPSPTNPAATSSGIPGSAVTNSTGAVGGATNAQTIPVSDSGGSLAPTATISGNAAQPLAVSPTSSINSTGMPQPATTNSGMVGANASGIANSYAYRTFTSTSQARVAALTAQKKVIQYAVKHPEARGIANKMLEILMSHW
ncbi:hypothetical protein QWZ18_28300, partial [Methylobacterium longum]|nr:hypothetical protein [Methylobacterium longum]